MSPLAIRKISQRTVKVRLTRLPGGSLGYDFRMRLRFRVWMPLLAVLLVLLSIATLLLYVLPAASSRLGGYVENQALARAATAANAVAGAKDEDLQRELDLAAETAEGELLVVDRQGRVVARAGERRLSPPSEEVLQSAANGERMNDTVGEQRIAVVPLIQGENLEGGVVFTPGGSEDAVYQLFLRSDLEAAALAGVLGGGVALLLAALLSRRVERLIAGPGPSNGATSTSGSNPVSTTSSPSSPEPSTPWPKSSRRRSAGSKKGVRR